jgi:hypothetical protein
MHANAFWFQNFSSQDQRASVLKLTTCGFIAYIHPDARIVSERQKPGVRNQEPGARRKTVACFLSEVREKSDGLLFF